ncbi:hypothetical protein LCGC14_1340430 [marine sediment metagenome]|uniref:Uncharacterized protein n=1 Tax=marine sediment metagenome TaxID=412755 RepID=A0A0F9KEM1_9ZZZZ
MSETEALKKTTKPKPKTDVEKKKAWEIAATDGKNSITFVILARTVNSAMSKANKYKKDKKLEKYETSGIVCIAVIDY